MSKIEWCNETWNPLIGCSKVSPGCKNCYAIQTAWIRQHNPKMAERYAGVVEKTKAGNLNWTGKVNVADKVMDKPLRKKKPTMYFVNSMSDLFHEAVPFEVIDKIYAVMGRCHHHIFQILTKRPDRMLDYYKSDPYQRILNASYQLNLPKWLSLGTGISNPNKKGNWGWGHVWVGASIENQPAADERIPLLLQVPAAVRFLSCEPLLGPVSLESIDAEITCPESKYCRIRPLTGIQTDMGRPCPDTPKLDWIIVGGESGKDARPMHLKWARDLRDQCTKAGVKYFFKQWGAWAVGNFFSKAPGQIWMGDEGIIQDHQPRQMLCFGRQVIAMNKVGKKKAGRLLDGREWNEFPGNVADDPDLHASGFDY